MNREPNVDEIVARWVDDGPEVAPERFVWAALEEVERMPQRGAWRIALENTPMFNKIALPVLGVAAVALVAILAYQQLGTDRGQAPSASPSPSGAATIDCGVRAQTATTVEVVWCALRGASERLVVHFTMTAPSNWAAQTYNSGQALYLRPGGRAIAFGLGGSQTVDDWVSSFSNESAFEVSAPEPISLDGTDGFVFDVRLAAGTNPGDAPPVLEDIELPWKLQEGSVARVWILDGLAEPLAIVTGSSEADFEAWAGTVGAAVESLRWGTSP
ncbi:MAG TPA: hypothetical protein VL687_08520 [Methylomirabilota bacterium]|jgi:hypothetical protein|nr:hypothetical protein [Methylomirabilota bacterium]